jgi:flagellin
MGFSINTNTDAINVHRNLTLTSSRMTDSLKRLSSGLRINSAKDDASGLAVANSFAAKIASLKVGSQNAKEAQAMLQTADGALSKINDILVRMKSLATEGASEQSDVSKLSPEFDKLMADIDAIANSTAYNGTSLLNAVATVKFQLGSNAVADEQVSLSTVDANTLILGTGGGGAALSTAGLGTHAASALAMGIVDEAIDDVSTAMAAIGASQNELQYKSENLAITMENYAASESAIRDVDMAAEMTNFTKNQILQQSGMAMLAQANAAPQQILSLLK